MIQPDIAEELGRRARRMRADIVRMTSMAGSGHPGSAFSAADIVSVLFFSEMNIDPDRPQWEDRDRFVLSKGHAAPVLYAALYERGFISYETMMSLRRIGSSLQGHPYGVMPGVDATTGSLGTGLSQAVGLALGARMRGSRSRIYAVTGDGECDEGQIWEAALSASHFKLGNLAVFVDHNRLQVDGPVDEVMGLRPLADKWRSFGWRVEEIDGHNYGDILGFLERSRQSAEQPSLAVANTTKGWGVSFMRGNKYHARVLTPDELELALAELQFPSEAS